MTTTSAKLQQSGGFFISKTHSTTYDFISPLKLDLTDKHVLITGAAWDTGVGYATATAFARAGASVIAVVDLHGVSGNLVQRLEDLATEAGRSKPVILSCTVDITKLESVQQMHDTLSKAMDGRLDVLVNNAAVMEPNKSLLDSDADVYWRTWQVNIHGLINMSRTFLPMLLSTETGLRTMVNVSSSGALTPRPGSASYRSSKLAILRWTECLQLEYEDQGLLTFCVNPGAIKTEISKGVAPEEIRNKFPHSPDVAGDTIAWLASERREWLAGRYVSCPWDMEELLAMKDEIVEMDKLKMRMAF